MKGLLYFWWRRATRTHQSSLPTWHTYTEKDGAITHFDVVTQWLKESTREVTIILDKIFNPQDLRC
jgi:hypothetical protein